MLKSQIVTKNDLKEAATLQRRQRYEDERKARIFNAKQRLFGVSNKKMCTYFNFIKSIKINNLFSKIMITWKSKFRRKIKSNKLKQK